MSKLIQKFLLSNRVVFLCTVALALSYLLIVPGLAIEEGNSRCALKPIRGVWYIGWDRGSYGDKTVDQDLVRLRDKLCVNYIALTARVYQDNKYSLDPHIDERTVDDEVLAATVTKIHDLGMKVVLLTPLHPDDDTWEGAIQPDNLKLWFDHWEKILVHYAKFSQKHGVEVLLLGSELPTLRGEPKRWNAIIKELRKHYSGKLSFSVNFWTKRSQYREVLNMTQWENLDYIGITGYFELTSKHDPSLAEVKGGWSSDSHNQKVIEDLLRLNKKYRKPIVFWEIGYQSKNGTNIYPWDYLRRGIQDQREQRDCWKAFLEVFEDKDWVDGFAIFAEQVGLPRDKKGYHGYNVLRKRAQPIFCNGC